jgi:hypothetical protein
MSSSVVARSHRFTAETRVARRARSSRSRAVAWGEIVAVVLIALALIAATLITSARVSVGGPNARVRIERGQTLWSVASQHPVAGLTTEQTADAIARLNGLEGKALPIGATIRVPVASENTLLVASR